MQTRSKTTGQAKSENRPVVIATQSMNGDITPVNPSYGEEFVSLYPNEYSSSFSMFSLGYSSQQEIQSEALEAFDFFNTPRKPRDPLQEISEEEPDSSYWDSFDNAMGLNK